MPIGLVIANVAATPLQTPITPANGVAGNISPAGAPPAGSPPRASGSEPSSGQAQLSPGFTVVVLQLLNEKGAVVSTIPSAQQLAAYRKGTATPPA